MPLSIATAPGSWGVEPDNADQHPPWGLVLDEIAAAGFDGTELGPFGYLPTRPAELEAALAARGLALAGGFVMEPLADSERRAATLELAERTSALLGALGARRLVVIDALAPARSRTAGCSDAATRLDGADWRALVATTQEIAEIAARHGLRAAFHPHAGTHVEFADEVERLLADTDPALVGLCLDTGHCAYAEIDPVDLCRRHAARVSHLHLKDVDAAALARARARELTFEAAVAARVFCPLGEGTVDFAALAAALDATGYAGWATVEQDRLAATDDRALEEAAASLRHLRRVGVAAGDEATEPVAHRTGGER